MGNKLKIDATVITTKGNVRSNNEDNFYFNGLIMKKTDNSDFCTYSLSTTGQNFIFAVCDGMGGEECGEEASFSAVQALQDMYVDLKSQKFSSITHLKDFMDCYVDLSNTLICKHSNSINKRMGTTLASVIFFEARALALNIGDSRVYLFRDSCIMQLTTDHNEAEQLIRLGILNKDTARLHISKNVLTRHLGISPQYGKMEADYSDEIKVQKGDLYLICSDGLTDSINDESLSNCLANFDSSYSTCKKLIDLSTKNNATDNITAQIIKISDIL